MQPNRRKAKRYQTNWKVALVYNPPLKKPVFHTLTHDLSVNGTSVQSATDEAINTVLNLLLIPPSLPGIEKKVIKLKAVVMSSRPFRNGFRLGFNFVQDAELEKLRATLNSLDLSGDTLPSGPYETGPAPAGAAPVPPAPAPAQPAAAPAPAPAPAPAAASPSLSSTSVLDMLKLRAEMKKKAEEQQGAGAEEEVRAKHKRTSDAMKVAYDYFMALIKNLDELKPEYAGAYTLVNVPDIKELAWQEGARADIVARPTVSGSDRLFNQVTLSYSIANATPLTVTRDLIMAEKTAQALKENGIEYSEARQRNPKGDPIGIIFTIPRKLRVRLELTCDDATGIFKLETRNLERFGVMKFELVPESLNQELLDQIALMIIGERHTVGKLIKRLL
jgi:hypothetical protein